MSAARRKEVHLANPQPNHRTRGSEVLGSQLGPKERLFYETLKNVFIGAPVEGESGYINLMRVKANYFEQVIKPRLKEEIDQSIQPFPSFREELFDKLYTFFRRYFNESGSIGLFFTPYHQSVYERVYTDDRDVMLFWKTAKLYYVKTDRLFRSMQVDVDGFKFFFDVSTLEHKKATEKRELVFSFKEQREDGTLVFTVTYSERGRTTRLDEIHRAVKEALTSKAKKAAVPSEETLDRAFRLFERQSEVDYFICKNTKAFLREQFDLWMWQYLLGKPGEEPATEWTETRIKQLQVLKRIAYRIIDFVAAFEDELVRIWNKPKFVLRSGYVITLDRIYERNPDLVEKILTHPRFAEQIEEWKDLGMVDDHFIPKVIWESDLTGKHLHPRYRFLPIDTRYFKDLELQILSIFDNLDGALDGWLIRSENYQALNTIRPKFRGHVQCIYIDPPYNSGSTEIYYINRYKHASWLCLMENRLLLARQLMAPDGAIVIAVDENEQERLGCLLEVLFGDFHRTCVAIVHNKKGIQGDYFSYNHDYAYFCISPGLQKINERVIPEEEWEWVNLRKWGSESERSTARNCFYPIFVKDGQIIGFGEVCPDDFHPGKSNVYRDDGVIEVYPVDQSGVERKWRYARDSVEKILPLLKVHVTREGEVQILKAQNTAKYKTVWDDPRYIAGDYGTRLITEMGIVAEENIFPKSLFTVMDCIHAVSRNDSLVLDFFAGSGTTAHAVINLNRQDGGRRKYILVEVADYFYTVLIPRIKKVIFSDKWRDGKAQPDGQGISHFIKYYELEQYEDTLRRARYLEDDLYTPPAAEDPCQYLFLRDPKLSEALEVNLEQGVVRVDLSKLYEGIDLAETVSNLTGKWIRRIHPDPEDPTRPGVVEFVDGTTVNLQDPDWRLIKPLIWW